MYMPDRFIWLASICFGCSKEERHHGNAQPMVAFDTCIQERIK